MQFQQPRPQPIRKESLDGSDVIPEVGRTELDVGCPRAYPDSPSGLKR